MNYTINTLHDERLDAVLQTLVASGAKSVLDLGCGTGALLRRLACIPQFESIVGVDSCGASLCEARDALREHLPDQRDRLSTVVGSYAERHASLRGFDACAMVETIEHVAPRMLGKVEDAVFGYYRPKILVITTPNTDFNQLLGLRRHEVRDPDHRFEWDRARFRAWVNGVARRNGYRVSVSGIGEPDLALGDPTQMALFSRRL